MQEILNRYANYLALELRLSNQSISTYLSEVRNFLDYCTQEKIKPFNLDPNQLISFLLIRQLNGLDQRTISKIISSLRSFYRFALLEGLAKNNPASQLELPKIKRKLPKVFSPEEIELLLKACSLESPSDLRDRALFELIYSCGLRVSEACDLTLNEVFLEDGFIKVIGKGEKERLVPIGEHAIYWLNKYLNEARPKLLQRLRHNFVFLNRFGHRLSRKGIWKRFKELSRHAGISGKVHTLRHSFATHLLKGGADLRAVQELLGHSDIGTTQIYTHLENEDLKSYHKKYHPKG